MRVRSVLPCTLITGPYGIWNTVILRAGFGFPFRLLISRGCKSAQANIFNTPSWLIGRGPRHDLVSQVFELSEGQVLGEGISQLLVSGDMLNRNGLIYNVRPKMV